MSYIVRILTFILTLSMCQSLVGQRKLIRQGNRYFDVAKYFDAIELYKQLSKKKHKIWLRQGISEYKVGRYSDALVSLAQAYKSGNRKEELYIYTAMTLHRLERYEESAEFYKEFLKQEKGCADFVVRELKKIRYALGNAHVERSAYVENLGLGINSLHNDIRAVVSPSSDKRLYFSSNRAGSMGGLRDSDGRRDEIYGDFAYDMYSASSTTGAWRMTDVFSDVLNGPKHEVLQGFGDNGRVLLYTSTDRAGNGALLVDTFSMEERKYYSPPKFHSYMDISQGDQDIFMYGDSVILFSSNTLGGYGGYDIFMLRRQEFGWSAPINMGGQINSVYNDKNPYLSKSGLTLYFSSDRPDGYGGYDIFSSRYGREAGGWSKPQNEGPPINSPADDTHFSLTNDGRMAYISSNRNGTAGYMDLYRAIYKTPRQESVAMWSLPLFVIDQERSYEKDTDDVESSSKVVQLETETTTPERTDTVAKKIIYLKPLYYGADDNVLTVINQGLLDEVISSMKIYPELSVILMSHSKANELPEYGLYFSMKRAEKARDYLMKQGISEDRITMYSWGSNYPMAIGSSPVADNANRRIDVRLLDSSNTFDITYQQNNLSSNIRDARHAEYTTLTKGLYYLIPFHRSSQMYVDDILKSHDVVIEKLPNSDRYTYALAIYGNYAAARKVKNEVLRLGYEKARIVPYVQGKKLSFQEAEILKTVYPDLGDYLLYE